MPKKNLSDKQERFAQAVLTSDSLSDAYRSVYSCDKAATKTINRRAYELAHENQQVAERIAELKAERCERTAIDADYVLKRLVEIDQMDVIDILQDDGSMKPISQWPPIWRSFISGMDVSELFAGSGDEREIIGMMKKIKWPDKVKNLELIGRHVNVQAWKDKVEHSGNVGIESLTDEQLDARIAALESASAKA